MFKRLSVILTIVAAMLFLPVVSLAAPDKLEADAQGTVTGLIELSNFTGEEITTYEKSYILSGSGKEKVIVTVYAYDDTLGFRKVKIVPEDNEEDTAAGTADKDTAIVQDMYTGIEADSNTVTDADTNTDSNISVQADTIKEVITDADTDTGQIKDLSWQIGASGRFSQELELTEGKNTFALYAEKDTETFEIIKMDITLLQKDVLTKIKDITVDIKEELKKLVPDGQER